MFKSIRHIILVFVCTGFLYSCTQKNKLPDLRERYGYMDTKPFGTYTAYRMFENIFPDKYISFNKKPFNKFYNNTHFDSASLYINISNKFYVTDEDAQSLIDFVYEGHTAFIAASVIDTVLLSKLFCRQANTSLVTLMNAQNYRQR